MVSANALINVSANMNNSRSIIAAVVVAVVLFNIFHKQNITPNINPGPNPSPVAPIVPKPTPLPYNNEILYDEYDKAISLAKQHSRKIVLVFGADWCPYCRDIKKDAKNNKIDNFKNYIVCFIDTDKNEKLTANYRIKGLPTSLIIDTKEQELARKTGYKNQDYNEWLRNSLQEGFVSWMSQN